MQTARRDFREADNRRPRGRNAAAGQAVTPLLHRMSEEAEAVGAVNTVQFSAGRRIGYNTDAWGFEENFRRGLRGASLTHVVPPYRARSDSHLRGRVRSRRVRNRSRQELPVGT